MIKSFKSFLVKKKSLKQKQDYNKQIENINNYINGFAEKIKIKMP